jgi:putative oxidoreductase
MTSNDPASATSAHHPHSSAVRSRAQTVAIWSLRVILALGFGTTGLMKLGGASAMVTMFDQIGVGQWLRHLIGSLELAAAIGVLIPVLSGLAALGLTALMIGAAVTNIAILHTNPLTPLVFLVISISVAVSQWPQTRAAARIIRRRG